MEFIDTGPPGPSGKAANPPWRNQPSRLKQAWFDEAGRLHLEVVIPCTPPEDVAAEIRREHPPEGPLDLMARATA